VVFIHDTVPEVCPSVKILMFGSVMPGFQALLL
jgi:hypothetical protein